MLGLTAEEIGTIILGLSLGIIGLMGGQKGKQIAQGKGPPSQTDVVEVAGAIVHPRDVEKLLKALEGQDPNAAKAFVEDVLSIAGISRVGGRSAGEIAERFLESRRRHWEDRDADGRPLRRTMGIASLGGATLDNEENYLIKKLFTAAGAIQIENQARI